MAEVVKSKLKLLYLADIFRRKTDERCGLTREQLIEELAAEGIAVERKTLYSDIDCLREFGMNIDKISGRPPRYALVDRDFTDRQLMLLADAVQSSRFLTASMSDDLVERIRALGSERIADGLKKHLHVEGRIKSQNESVFAHLDKIQEAMDRRRKVSFRYFRYNERKERVLRRDGERYLETPVQLMYMDDEYYLIVWNDKHEGFASYRVDRMEDIEVAAEDATRNRRIAEFDVARYQQRVFGMFSGRETGVVLRVEPSAMSTVIDRFGEDIAVKQVPEAGYALVNVTVMQAPTFYGWLATLGRQVRIESPAFVREAYADYLRGILEDYSV